MGSRRRNGFSGWVLGTAIALAALPGGCKAVTGSVGRSEPSALKTIEQAAVAEINADLVRGPLTMDVGIIVPSNLDTGFDLVSVPQMLDGIRSAKKIFGAVDVQIRLLWVKSGPVPEEHLSITSTPMLTEPRSQHVGMYTHLKRHPKALSEGALAAFEALVPREQSSNRTIYLVVLQDVFYPFFAPRPPGDDLVAAVTPTSGLSFPPYIHGAQIPRHLRGVISISNLTRGKSRFKTIAHEIGHKTLNVSHEYRQTAPEFEVIGEGGLMLYGAGVEIPSGRDGRWHRERLELSPFLYREDEAGKKTWNPDFQEGGHYFDPIYGSFTIAERGH
jgi:hypothetical protein